MPKFRNSGRKFQIARCLTGVGKLTVTASLFLCSDIDAKTIYVNGAIGTSGKGTSWSNAYKYLRDALENSSASDEIFVAKGTYFPDDGKTGIIGNREFSFELNGQKVYGGFAGNETSLSQRNIQANPTSLSGAIWDQPGEDVYWSLNVVKVISNSTLDGVIVENGHASGADSWNYPNVTRYDEGGGCYVEAGQTLTLSGCIFRNNRALSFGGAIMVADNTGRVIAKDCLFENNRIPLEYDITTSLPAGGAIKGNVQATNCRFIGNTVAAINFIGGTSSIGRGGAIAGDATLDNCYFSLNRVTAVAETPEASGGAVQGNVVATNSTFIANQSDAIVVENSQIDPEMEEEPAANSSGGAISGGSVTAANCSFSENKSGAGAIMETDGSGKGGGGAIFVSTGTSTLMNCVFVKNTSGVRGGAIHCDTVAEANGRSISVYNSTFMDNGVATGFKGAAVSCGGIVRLLNNIFWYSSPSVSDFEQSNLIHVIIEGALRNSPENYPNVATVTPNIVRGGRFNVTRGIGGDIFLGAVENTILTGDPLFVNSADPDGADNIWGTLDDGLRIQSGSAAIGAAQDPRTANLQSILPNDILDADKDGDSGELISLDYASFVRVQNTYVDLGAYEFGDIISAPEVSVFQVGSTELLNGGSCSFGSLAKGKTRKKTFIIKNLGTDTLGGILFSMKKNSSFRMEKPTIKSLKPGASAKFTITFRPKSKRKLSSGLQIFSNDKDENPFSINFRGKGTVKKSS
jgi:predicted outer membrane repeat protein